MIYLDKKRITKFVRNGDFCLDNRCFFKFAEIVRCVKKSSALLCLCPLWKIKNLSLSLSLLKHSRQIAGKKPRDDCGLPWN